MNSTINSTFSGLEYQKLYDLSHIQILKLLTTFALVTMHYSTMSGFTPMGIFFPTGV